MPNEKQREMMDRSMASLGLHTPRRKQPIDSAKSTSQGPERDSSDDDDEVDVDLSILSSTSDQDEDEMYIDRSKKDEGRI